MTASDAEIPAILRGVRTIAVVGASPKAARPSYGVVEFLAQRGYRVFPVNPAHGGERIAGLEAYASLADIPEAIDMVDVFRASEHVAAVLDEALKLPTLPKAFWTQLEVVDEQSAARAEAAGMTVVMDRCPKIELMQLD